MISGASPAEVLSGLGDKVVQAIVDATDGARDDFSDLRDWRPTWVPTMFQRGVANLIHERIWARLAAALEPHRSEGILVVDREPLREVIVNEADGRAYRFRVKRHSPRDMVTSYPTRSDVDFWAGGFRQPTFDGFEEIRLAAGYRWDPELREMGSALISYREGKYNPIWTLDLDQRRAGGAMPIWSETPPPNLPLIDLERALTDEDDVAEGGEQAP